MTQRDDRDRELSRQGRMVALVVAATMILWMAAQWLGGRFDLDPRYAFLFDFAAMAAFVWGMIVTWQIWRKRGDE